MTEGGSRLPEWAPAGGGEGFRSRVVEGVGEQPPAPPVRPSRSLPSVEELEAGIRAGNRTLLARAITLVESNAEAHQDQAQHLLQALMPLTGKSLRVGVTGVPGAGKSTLIDALGAQLCDAGHRVAVLAVDPSSSVTGGSILGDKTRMEKLMQRPGAFVRPSPTGGCLGGVARKTRETLLLCEAFGFDVILLETVGVGQSEVTVRSMVDFFLLVQIAGAGDELQGIKKGVIELADAIVVNKADGDNLRHARIAKAEYNRVLSFLPPYTAGWKTKATLVSARTGEGIEAMWETILGFQCQTTASGVFAKRRREQNLDWLEALLDEALRRHFLARDTVRIALREMREAVAGGRLPPVKAVGQLLDAWEQPSGSGS
jgi:LAO/AO transport system kinase